VRTSRAAFAAIGAALWALAVAAPPALADDRATAAAAIFRAATDAYARRDFRAAALSFEAANQKAPHGGTMYNAALAWEAAGEPARAADDYDAALSTAGLDGEKAKDARDRLARLEASLGRIEITAPSGATAWAAHAERVATPARVHVAPGEIEVRVVLASGEAKTQRVRVRAGEAARVSVAAPAPSAPAPSAPAPPPPPPPDTDSGGTQRAIGWVTVGGGALFGGAAIALGVATLDARDKFDAGGRTDADLRDRAVTLRALTNAACIAAGVTGVVGVALVLTAPRARPAQPSTAGVGLCLSGPRAAICGRF